MKFVFSDNPLQNFLRPVSKIEQSWSFMESLLADFVQVRSAFAKFLFSEGRFITRL